MVLDLSEFLSVLDKKGHFEVPVEMEYFKTKRTSHKISDKSDVIIDVRNVGKKRFKLDARFNLNIIFPCDRCLQDVVKEFNSELSRKIDMNESEVQKFEDIDEIPYMDGNELDVERLVYNELLVNLPMKVLCNDNCKGICNRCGVNLNHDTCDCDSSDIDPRMSKILDVFNKFKEV